jgi:hypothetical protein
MMSSEEDALIEALEKRISTLEAIVLGSDPKVASQHAKVSRYVNWFFFYVISSL